MSPLQARAVISTTAEYKFLNITFILKVHIKIYLS